VIILRQVFNLPKRINIKKITPKAGVRSKAVLQIWQPSENENNLFVGIYVCFYVIFEKYIVNFEISKAFIT
jgi:hypothetical protein